MTGLAAGRLKHRIEIQEPDQVDNGTGGRRAKPGTTGWRKLASTRAEIVALRGQEAVRENIERAVQLWRVTTRFRRDVTPRNRILWGDIVMDITSAAPNDAGDGLVMTCSSGANGK